MAANQHTNTLDPQMLLQFQFDCTVKKSQSIRCPVEMMREWLIMRMLALPAIHKRVEGCHRCPGPRGSPSDPIDMETGEGGVTTNIVSVRSIFREQSGSAGSGFSYSDGIVTVLVMVIVF